ncbi:hypothetical protein D9M71_432030 [compost metagenome]
MFHPRLLLKLSFVKCTTFWKVLLVSFSVISDLMGAKFLISVSSKVTVFSSDLNAILAFSLPCSGACIILWRACRTSLLDISCATWLVVSIIPSFVVMEAFLVFASMVTFSIFLSLIRSMIPSAVAVEPAVTATPMPIFFITARVVIGSATMAKIISSDPSFAGATTLRAASEDPLLTISAALVMRSFIPIIAFPRSLALIVWFCKSPVAS